MSDSLIVQFIGYEVRPLAREYTFTVRNDKAEPREFTLSIASAAFNCRRARFQDAPDICSLRLRRELAADANHPADSHFEITDAELDEYRGRHTPKPSSSPYKKKVNEGF